MLGLKLIHVGPKWNPFYAGIARRRLRFAKVMARNLASISTKAILIFVLNYQVTRLKTLFEKDGFDNYNVIRIYIHCHWYELWCRWLLWCTNDAITLISIEWFYKWNWFWWKPQKIYSKHVWVLLGNGRWNGSFILVDRRAESRRYC